MIKSHDYFLELMSNPDFNPQDFQLAGLSSDNTSIQDKSKYKNASVIKDNPLFQTNGKFDEHKFNLAYDEAMSQYNELSRLTQAEQPFFRENIFAPETLKQPKDAPEFQIQRVANPLRQQQSFVSFGVQEAPTKSLREIAESKPTFDFKTGQWVDSPNDAWYDNFFNPKVLAQWDFDADEQGNPTSDPSKIFYHKGDKKIDPTTGTYYYETLGGRDIYGKEVLSGFDTLTVDGSNWNTYDFFDSDDQEKSTWGSLARAVAQIAPAFVPGMGEIYIGTRVGLSLMQLLPTISKTFTGLFTESSDNSFLSSLEGINKAFSFSSSDKVQGSQEAGIEADPLTMENGLKLVSDVFTQLAEQRWLFKYGTALFSGVKPGVIGETEKAAAARKALIEENATKYGLNFERLAAKASLSKEDLTKELMTQKAANFKRAELAFRNKIKNGQDLSKHLSMAYMTGITTADSYGEAKQQGATDAEAAMFALGYTAAEYALLSSDLGQWILPELKLEKFQMQQAVKNLAGITRENKNAKKTLAKLFDYAKSLATQNYSDKVLTSTAKMTASSMLSEGVEETTEEFLLDFSKTIFNIAQSLRGRDAKFDDAWENMALRYGMSFGGGLIGGGLATALPGYRAARESYRQALSPDKNSQAYQQVVSYIANGQLNELKKEVSKNTFGDKNLSINQYETEDGRIEYKPANSYEESQDYYIKQQLYKQFDMINGILESEGAKITTGELQDDLIRRELKFGALLGSNVLGVYTNDFANLLVDLTDVAKKIDDIKFEETGHSELTGEEASDEQKRNLKELSEADKEKLKELQEEQKELRKKLQAYKDGTMAKEFISEALFEMDASISSEYALTDRVRWAEKETGKKYVDISKEEREELSKKWDEAKLARREIVHDGFQVFKKNQKALSNMLKQHEEKYFNIEKGNPIKELEQTFGNLQEQTTNGKDVVKTASEWVADKSRIDIWAVLLNSLKGKVDDNIFNELSKQFDDTLIPFKDYLGVETLPKTMEEFDALSPEAQVSIIEKLNLDPDSEDLLDIIEEKQHDYYNQKGQEQIAGLSVFLSNEAVQNAIIDSLKKAKYLTPTTKQYLRDFFTAVDIVPSAKEKLVAAINAVNSSPIEELLSNMIVTLQQEGFDVSGMSTNLAELLIDLARGRNLENFMYGEDIDDKIQVLLDLINLAHAHIEAARTEIVDGNLGDFIGYNATVNELNGNQKLPTLQSSTVNTLLYDLARVYQDLVFYRKLMAENSGAKLTDHIKTEVKVNTLYYNNLKRWQINIPDDWKDKGTILKAINDATTLKSVIDSKKSIVTDEERSKMFKERLAIEQAIYNFFDTNKDNLNDPEKLSQLFKGFNFLEEKTSVLNSATESENDSDFMWYIASLAAVDPTAILKEYNEVISGQYAPVIAQEEAIRRAYSYIINPKTFEKFADAYIVLYKDQLTKDRAKKGITETHFDTFEIIQTKRHFLIEGIAGSGKTSATLETLSKMLEKYHPELTKRVWVVSNSVENAKKTASKLAFKNVAYMSKGSNNESNIDKSTGETVPSYFERISRNYKQEYNEDGSIRIFEDELIADEDEVNRYKNVTVNDSLDDVPTLVLIDEVSSLSQQDLLLSEDFLNHYDNYALVFGDFHQIGAEGTVLNSKGEETNTIVRVGNSNYMGSWKLGSAIRSNNTYKQTNCSLLSNSIPTIAREIQEFKSKTVVDSKYVFSYFESFQGNDKGLYGDKVIETFDDNCKKSIKNLLDAIKEYNSTHEGEFEILNFIYDSANSELYKYLDILNQSEEYKGLINPISAAASQGQEGLYYIVDLSRTFQDAVGDINSDNGYTEQEDTRRRIFAKMLYTAVSRAKQGTIIFGNYEIGDDGGNPPFLRSEAQSRFQSSNLSSQAMQNFAEQRKKIISEGLGDIDVKTPKAIREVAVTPPTPPAPPADVDVEDEKEIMRKNRDKPVQIENNSEEELNVLMHTFMCYETGCTVKEKGVENPDPTDPEATLYLGRYFKERLDNLNGLLQIHLRSNGKIDPITDRRGNEIKVDEDGRIIKSGDPRADTNNSALEILNTLRNQAIHATNIDSLTGEVQKILRIKDVPIHVRYYYKNTVRDFKDEQKTIDWFNENPEYQKFYKGKDEVLAAIFNPDNTNKEIKEPKDQEIGIMIALEDGTQLCEIPVCKITSPLTLLSTQGFEKLKEIYINEAHSDVSLMKKIVKEKLRANDNVPNLKSFAMLLDLYTTSQNTISFLPENFTLGGGYTIDGVTISSSVSGITVSSHEKGAEDVYLNNSDYYFTGKWIELSEYRKRMPWRKVSEPYVLTNEGKSVLDIKPGDTFVLASDFYGTEVSDDWLLQQYIKQETEGTQKRIKLLYIMPPASTLDEYLYNLHLAYNKYGQNAGNLVDKDLGNKITAYRITSFLLNDSDFLTPYKEWANGKTDKEHLLWRLDKTTQLVKALQEYEDEKGKPALFKLLDTPTKKLPDEWKSLLREGSGSEAQWLFPISDKLSLRQFFQSNLHSMLLGAEGSIRNYRCENGKLVLENDNPNKAKVEAYRKVMSKHWKDGVYYHLGLNTEESGVKVHSNGKTVEFAKIKDKFNSTNDYRFSNGAKINGKADSPQVIMNILPLLNWIIKGGLGRNTNQIEPSTSNIFAEDPANDGIYGLNMALYMEQKPIRSVLPQNVKDFNAIMKDTKLPKGFTKENLKKIFKELPEEEQNEILKDPREFIYLNTDKQLLTIKVGDKYIASKVKGIKDIIIVENNILFRYSSDPTLVYKLNEDGKSGWNPITLEEFKSLTSGISNPLKIEYLGTFKSSEEDKDEGDTGGDTERSAKEDLVTLLEEKHLVDFLRNELGIEDESSRNLIFTFKSGTEDVELTDKTLNEYITKNLSAMYSRVGKRYFGDVNRSDENKYIFDNKKAVKKLLLWTLLGPKVNSLGRSNPSTLTNILETFKLSKEFEKLLIEAELEQSKEICTIKFE